MRGVRCGLDLCQRNLTVWVAHKFSSVHKQLPWAFVKQADSHGQLWQHTVKNTELMKKNSCFVHFDGPLSYKYY